MLFWALLFLLAAATAWTIVALLFYTFLYGSIIFSYFFIWDDDTRRQLCPKGLWHTIIFDE